MSAAPAAPVAVRPRTLTEAWRSRPEADLVALLQRRPDLTFPPPRDLGELTARAVTTTSVQRALDDLDAWLLLVVEGLAALPDPCTYGELATLVGDSVDDALVELSLRALVWGEPDALHLVRPVREVFQPYPGGLAAPSAVPLADADVDARLAECTPEMRAVLDRLAFAPAGAVRQADRPVTRDSARTPVEALLARGLLRPLDRDTVLLPREVAWRVREGRLSPEPVPPAPPVLAGSTRGVTLVDRAGAGAAFGLLHDVELVARVVVERAVRPLRAGGLGARDVSVLAREVGSDVGHTTFVLECAAAAGLLVADGSRLLPTSHYDRWVAQPAGERWLRLAQAWRDTPRQLARSAEPGGHALGPEADSRVAARLRRVLLEEAVAAGAGTVLAQDDLATVLAWRRPRLLRGSTDARASVAATWREAAWMGVVALGAVTGFAAALLAGELPAELADLFPAPVEELVVQADLTAVAPGPLRHDVAEQLRLLADQESRGGAEVWRFSAGSVRRAFDAGWSADRVQEWLAAHATTELPQPLTYLVADVARHHGRVRVGPALSFVQTDDDAQAAAVLRHPRAAELGLRRLAPGVVVAAVEADELVAALREQGVNPRAEDELGRKLRAPAPARAPGPVTAPAPVRPSAEEVAAMILAVEQAHPAPAPSERLGTDETLDELRSAVQQGRPVRVTWVGPDGRSEARDLAPLDLDAGRLRAVDRAAAQIVTIALGRIASVRALA